MICALEGFEKYLSLPKGGLALKSSHPKPFGEKSHLLKA
jgi:hypothetical protein